MATAQTAKTIGGIPIDETETAPMETVLVVDDSRLQRWLLSSYLNGWGYNVIQAASGQEAMEICQKSSPDLIVSDWMMPGMDGLEFCQAYRAMRGGRYGYFILLTSKTEKEEVAHGLDVGADDFLTKPVHAAELRARIRAGQRVLHMERQLTETNRIITANLDRKEKALAEAQKLQQSLVRERFRVFPGADVSLLLHPAGHIGGDLVGVFDVTDTEIGIYSIDVSGHDIASALMTARIAAYLSGNAPGQNIAIATDEEGRAFMRSPAVVAANLNALMLEGMETDIYLTMVLARVDLAQGLATIVQAGHPHPALHRADGTISFIGDGGLPIGLIPDAEFTDFQVSLSPGDRLFLGSDGITECLNPEGVMLEDAGLSRFLKRGADKKGLAFFDTFLWDLTSFAGDQAFEDDVSGVLLEFSGCR